MASVYPRGRIKMAGAEEGPKLLDADTLIDEILAKKGPQKYTGGLSEENWEQASLKKLVLEDERSKCCYRSWNRFHSSWASPLR